MFQKAVRTSWRVAALLFLIPLVSIAGAAGFLAAGLGSASASTPSLFWEGANRLAIVCDVSPSAEAASIALAAEMCGAVQRIAKGDAPIPVQIMSVGDPVLIAPGTVILLVHGSIEPAPGGRLLTYVIRPHRVSTPNEILFGAAPRAVMIGHSRVNHQALSAALESTLAEVLPWRFRPGQPRPLTKRP